MIWQAARTLRTQLPARRMRRRIPGLATRLAPRQLRAPPRPFRPARRVARRATARAARLAKPLAKARRTKPAVAAQPSLARRPATGARQGEAVATPPTAAKARPP